MVDDAIVMLENIVRYMEMGKGRYEAAMLASKEIGFTIVSMTLSLIAVFIPVLFLGGMVGRLLHEFSVTIIVAILISGFVSLTFTPMLGSRYLPPHNRKHGTAVSGALESGFNALPALTTLRCEGACVTSSPRWSLRLAMLVGTVYLFMTMPTGFIPSQDSGFIFGVTMARAGHFLSSPWPSGRKPLSTSCRPIRTSEIAVAFSRRAIRVPLSSEAARTNARSPSIETIELAATETGAGTRAS